MAFQKPTNFNNDLTSRVDNLESSQRYQEVELRKATNLATGVVTVDRIGVIDPSQIIGRDSAAGAGECQPIDIGDGLQITSNTLLIGAGAVTLDKLQAIGELRLLGRSDTGSGSPEELTFGVGITSASGAVQQDMLFKIIDADEVVSNVNTSQAWFPSAGKVNVPIGTFMFDGVLYLTTGTTSHSLEMRFDGGTATIGYFVYWAIGQSVLESNTVEPQTSTWCNKSSANTVLAASTVAARCVRIVGVARFTSTGTFRPEFRFSAAPGGTNKVVAGSHIRMLRIGDDTATEMGTWS